MKINKQDLAYSIAFILTISLFIFCVLTLSSKVSNMEITTSAYEWIAIDKEKLKDNLELTDVIDNALYNDGKITRAEYTIITNLVSRIKKDKLKETLGER